jgi:hypothetical protein
MRFLVFLELFGVCTLNFVKSVKIRQVEVAEFFFKTSQIFMKLILAIIGMVGL